MCQKSQRGWQDNETEGIKRQHDASESTLEKSGRGIQTSFEG